MVCLSCCGLSFVFIVSMILSNNMVYKSKVVESYAQSLSKNLQEKYETLAQERLSIYYFGFFLGLIISGIFISYQAQTRQFSNLSIICTIAAISFFTNYFYYILAPKTDYMLNHIKEEHDIKNWLIMYRSMQVYCHSSLVFGILALVFLGLAFRNKM